MEEHIIYMRRCIDLARRGAGYHFPNPLVGAVIVHDQKIIGEGYHQRYGEGHAEVNAVASVKPQDLPLLAQSTIYVSLEPCFHFGKTPPCVELILKHRIPKVIIGCKDPYIEVAGKSIEKLRENGVEVEIGILSKEIEWLNRRFFTVCRLQRPYISLKWAQSQDGYIGQQGVEIPISNPASKYLVHRWRSEEAAILVGTNTAATDNPALSNRLYTGPTPLRIVLDRNLRLAKSLQLFDGSIPTLVFTAQSNPPKKPTDNLNYQQCSFDEQLLPNMLAELQKRKIQSLFVEGGAQLLQSFINSGLWDEARILQGKTHLGAGIAAPRLHGHQLRESYLLDKNQVQIYTNNLTNGEAHSYSL